MAVLLAAVVVALAATGIIRAEERREAKRTAFFALRRSRSWSEILREDFSSPPEATAFQEVWNEVAEILGLPDRLRASDGFLELKPLLSPISSLETPIDELEAHFSAELSRTDDVQTINTIGETVITVGRLRHRAGGPRH